MELFKGALILATMLAPAQPPPPHTLPLKSLPIYPSLYEAPDYNASTRRGRYHHLHATAVATAKITTSMALPPQQLARHHRHYIKIGQIRNISKIDP